MGLVNKSDYLYAKLLDKASEVTDELIELDDKEIIRLGLKSQDILTVNIDHIEWANTEPLETYEGTKASLPKINIYWDDETITEASINYTMVDNVSYYLEAGNYELRAIYRDFTSTNTLPITVIEKLLISIEWENTNPITIQQNHKAYLPYIKLNYNDGKFKRLSSQSPGVTLSDSEYYLELGEKTLTATYKGFVTNELTINVIEEEIIDEDTHDYSQDYLTFEALEDGVFSFTSNRGYSNASLYYSINNGDTWELLNDGQNTITIYKNTKIIFKDLTLIIASANNNNSLKDSGIINFHSTGKFNVSGNIELSLRGYNNITFVNLFSTCDNLISAKNLILTQNIRYHHYYTYMFYECTSLIEAPQLPAMQLTSNCYEGMFIGCTSLIEAPQLPAMQLADSCYNCMFSGCTSLTSIPELPAEILAQYCYAYMFAGCTSLIEAPILFANFLQSGCYSGMFYGCKSLINAPELPALQLATSCYYEMFYGCESLVNAPELPALQLATSCYCNMFSGCTSLVNAPELPATEMAKLCYAGMFSECSSLINSPKLIATILAYNCYGGMFSGCINIVSITIYGLNINESNLVNSKEWWGDWLYGVNNFGIIYKNPEFNWPINEETGKYLWIPENWEIKDIEE